jgi:hypothetical protein
MIYLLILILILIQPAKAVELQSLAPVMDERKPVAVTAQTTELQVGSKYELGALGITHNMLGLITYVDPGSHLRPAIDKGDVLYSVNGVEAHKALLKKVNYGDDKTTIILGIIKYPDSLYYLRLAEMPSGQKTVHVHYFLCHRASLNDLKNKDLAQGLAEQFK